MRGRPLVYHPLSSVFIMIRRLPVSVNDNYCPYWYPPWPRDKGRISTPSTSVPI